MNKEAKYDFKLKEKWACQRCTAEVRPVDGVATSLCTACKIPRTSTWSCEACTLTNVGIDNRCVACNARNPLIEGVKVARNMDGTWNCPQCRKGNKLLVDVCGGCRFDNVIIDPLDAEFRAILSSLEAPTPFATLPIPGQMRLPTPMTLPIPGQIHALQVKKPPTKQLTPLWTTSIQDEMHPPKWLMRPVLGQLYIDVEGNTQTTLELKKDVIEDTKVYPTVYLFVSYHLATLVYGKDGKRQTLIRDPSDTGAHAAVDTFVDEIVRNLATSKCLSSIVILGASRPEVAYLFKEQLIERRMTVTEHVVSGVEELLAC